MPVLKTKSIFTTKTFWINILTGVVSVATVLSTSNDILSPEIAALLTSTVIPIINILLRFWTKDQVTITGEPPESKS